MKLRSAEATDLTIVLEWLANEHDCKLWAGPNIRYPAAPDTAWSDMGASTENTFVLVDDASRPIAFGQLLLRETGSLHLARLIVDPELRGQGIGRELCLALIKVGETRHHPDCFTLNVYDSNLAAFKLYRSLGFEVRGKGESGAVAMVKPLLSPGRPDV